MKQSYTKLCILSACTFISVSSLAQSAITMTVDIANETISYSGTAATSEAFMSSGVSTTYFLSNQATTNPNPSPVSSAPANGNLMSTLTPIDAAYRTASVGQVSVTHTLGLVSVFLGSDTNFGADRNIILTASPNGNATQSYSGFSAANKTHLESLNGTQLFFVNRGTGTFVNTSGGGPAMTVNVIPAPEPSSFALLGLGGLSLLMRRKR